MASGAGLNRVFRTILNLTTASTTVATPLTGYGTGLQGDSGMIMNDAMNFTKWTFQMSPADNYTVTLYGTTDKRAYDLWRYNLNPNIYLPQWGGVAPTLPASAWVILAGPSEQGSTGQTANPLTAAAPLFIASSPLLAVRAVLTATSVPVGSVQITCEAVP